MARKPGERWASDEARLKTRPHVKIHLTTRSHPRYREVFENLEGRAIIWGVWLLAVQYHAAQTSNRVTLGPSDLMWLSGRNRFDYAVVPVRYWCDRMGYTTEVRGRCLIVEVRNLQRKQGFGPAVRGDTPRDDPAPEVQKYRSTEVPSNPPPPPQRGEAPTPKKKRGRHHPDRELRRQVEKIWPRLQAVANDIYGRSWGTHPSKRATELLVPLLRRGVPEADLVTAIHGCAALNRVREEPERLMYVRAQTVYQPTKFDGYVELGREAQEKRARGSPRAQREAQKTGEWLAEHDRLRTEIERERREERGASDPEGEGT